MSKLLFVTSSLMGETSKSRHVAGELIATLNRQGANNVTTRHLTADSMPHLDMATLGALATPHDKRTPEQAAKVTFADSVIAEAEAADTIVLAVPMYNFSIPSTLKAWFDHLARAGRTFRYTEKGPEGLLKNKKVYVVASRGGFYGAGTPAHGMDFQEPYIRTILGFVGLTDVTFIAVEGQAVGADAAAKGVEVALKVVADVAPLASAA